MKNKETKNDGRKGTTGRPIGEELWFMGYEVKVISEPYILYGGLFQDVKRKDGKVQTIIVKE